MRHFSSSLVLILFLTACAVPAQQITPVESESQTQVLDGSFERSLLVTQSLGDSEGSILFPMDSSTGKSLPDFTPISLGQTFFSAFSPDRGTLAVVSFPNNYSYDGSLLLIDIHQWKSRRFDFSISSWVSTMVFSPNGKQLAIAHGETSYKLSLIDLERGVIQAQKQLDTFIPRLQFTANGEALMLYRPTLDPSNRVTAGPPQVMLLDTTDLATLWSTDLQDVQDGIFPRNDTVTASSIYESGQGYYLSPGLTFDPSQDLLYIVHADTDRLTTVDFAGRKIKTVEIEAQLTWFEQLLSLDASTAHAKVADGTSKQAVISPDGRFLYVMGTRNATSQDGMGNWQTDQTLLGLEILEASSGRRLDHMETDTTELSLSPDGRFLYLRNWGSYQQDPPWTDIFDTATRKFIAHKTGIAGMPAYQVNGAYLLVSTYSISETSNEMNVLTPDGFNMLANWKGPDYIWWLTTP